MPPLPKGFYGSLPTHSSVPAEHAIRRWERIRAYLPPLEGLRVLDVGCAEGLLTRRMSGEGASRVVGVEREITRVEWARQLPEAQAGRVIFLHGEAQHLSRVAEAHPEEFAGGFDLVTFTAVLQHVPKAYRKQALCEVGRLSNDWLLVAAPFAHGLKELLQRKRPVWWLVRRIVQSQGFSLEKYGHNISLWRRK